MGVDPVEKDIAFSKDHTALLTSFWPELGCMTTFKPNFGERVDKLALLWNWVGTTSHSLEGLMLKLKLQYFAHLMWKLTHLKRPWCWERLKAGGEGDSRGWDGWMASPTQWTWVWVSFRSWWWTGKPSVLQFMRLQRVGYDWVTELNWTSHEKMAELVSWEKSGIILVRRKLKRINHPLGRKKDPNLVQCELIPKGLNS